MSNHELAPNLGKEQQPETAPNFAVLTPFEFLRDLIEESKRALIRNPDRGINSSLLENERPGMGMEAMYIEFYGDAPRSVFNTVREAASCGFNTELHLDGFSKVTRDGDLILIPARNRGQKTHRGLVTVFAKKRLQMLEQTGVRVVETNPAETYVGKALIGVKGVLERGFNHRKIYYITNGERKLTWIGGMNIARGEFLMIDCMVKITDPAIVDALVNQFSKVKEDGKSTEIPCTEDTSLLADERYDKSIIKEKAVAIVEDAKETVFVSSAFPPSGEFMEALQRARQRGVHVAYITVNPTLVKRSLILKLHRYRTNFLDVLEGRENQGIPLLLPGSQVVHGKVLVVDERIAIVGSYNFVGEGNKELSLYSINPTLVRNLVQFLKDTVGKENLKRKLDGDFVVATA